MANDFPGVEPHDELESIFEDAWYLTGSVQFKPLVRLPRNMAVFRHDGELMLVNAIRLDPDGEKALDALGKVAHIMRIGFHGMDDAYYLDRYDAKHWAANADGLGDAVTTLDEGVELPFPGARVFRFEQTNTPEAAIFVERSGGLLVTCDAMQHWVPKRFMSTMAKVVTSVMGFKKPAQIGPPWRKVQTPAGGSLKKDFERLAQLEFDKLIGGHGGLLESGAQEALRASIVRELG